MRVAIVGSGSIGLLVTFYLAQKNVEPLLITKRENQAEIINDKGINLISENQPPKNKQVLAASISKLSELGPIDIAIITVKSYQVDVILEKMNKIDVPAILFLQNGMAHTEQFSRLKIPEIGVAVVEHGAIRENDYTVNHTGVGRIRWSYVRKKNNKLASLFLTLNDPLFPIKEETNWYAMLVSKLIVNACINPLTALLGVRNGELIENERANQLMWTVFDEVMDVLHIQNREMYWESVCLVCENTANNRSSMLVDVEKHQQTEIDSILGFLLNKNRKQKKKATMVQFLYDEITAMEKK